MQRTKVGPVTDIDPVHRTSAPLVLIVDDARHSATLLADLLATRGYRCECAMTSADGLALARALRPDLIVLDVLMPGMNGFELCASLRADPLFLATPVLMVTSLDAKEERIRGLDAGADDFLSKPIVKAELFARARSLLRVKTLYDEVLRQREELAAWSSQLERRVQEKLVEIEQLSKLKRFFSPALARRLLEHGGSDALRSHRCEVTVLFADLRGFSTFAEVSPAEEVMQVLKEFHKAMGTLIHRHDGTLERFTGDGMMVFFNDPDPVPDHAQRAFRLALDMQAQHRMLQTHWRARGIRLGLGLGIASGIATVGAIGFESRLDYAAIGHVTNLAARLCSEAADDEILMSDAVWAACRPSRAGPSHTILLKGLQKPVRAYTVRAADLHADHQRSGSGLSKTMPLDPTSM